MEKHLRSSLAWGVLSSLTLLHCGTPSSTQPEDPAVLPPAPEPAATADIALPEVGGQTGDDSSQSDPECAVTSEFMLGLDETSPLGFVPNDTLSFVTGSRTSSLGYSKIGPDGAAVASTTTDLQVGVELVGSMARVREQMDVLGRSCPPLVDVDVRLTLTSTDGAVAEQVDGKLELRGGSASLVTSIPVADLQGDFQFEPAVHEGLEPAALSLSISFTRRGQHGVLAEQYGSADARAPSLGIAEWPAHWDCSSRGIPATYEEMRPSPDDLLAVVRGAPALTLLDAHGESAPVHIEIEPTANSACVRPEADTSWTEPPETYDALSVLTRLTLNSSLLPGGSVSLPMDLQGLFLPDASQFAHSSLRLLRPCGSAGNALSAQEFLSQCGDWGVDLGGVEAVFLDVVESVFSPEGAGYTIFEIRGFRWPGCTPGPMGWTCAEGMEGSDFEVVTIGRVSFTSDSTD